MAQRQRDEIEAAITGLMTAGEAGASLCCTIEARTAEGEDVSIQVMQETINISPYAHDDDPLERLESCGATDDLADDKLDVLEWEPGTYATIAIEGLAVADVAQLVDQVFTRLRRCKLCTVGVDGGSRVACRRTAGSRRTSTQAATTQP